MELTITAKVRIYPNDEQVNLLQATIQQIRNALNCVSHYIYHNNCLAQRKIHDDLYYHLRKTFNLKSQMAQSVIKTAIAKYKSAKSNGNNFSLIKFKKPEYDLVWNRDYFLNKQQFSINTLDGRIYIAYETKSMEKYFDGTYTFGTAKLVYKHGKYFLHIPVTKDYIESNLSDISKVVGVDLGINFLATTYNSKGKTTFYNGKEVKSKRVKYKSLRKELQQR